MLKNHALTFLSLALTAAAGLAADPQEPAELGALRHDFEKRKADAVRPVFSWYETELSRLERTFTVRGNLDGAIAIRNERELLKNSQAGGGSSELKELLDDTRWQWNGNPPQQIVFKKDGTLECDAWNRAGLVLKWKVTAPNVVTYSVVKGNADVGRDIKLTFSPDFKTFHGKNTDGSPINPSPRIK